MSVRIFKDVEEAIAREVRRITFHDNTTVDKTILADTFDPFTGELVTTHIEPSFYDSSADTGYIQYPHFFIKLLKTREDRFTGRVTTQYGLECKTSVKTSPVAYEIVTSASDGIITAPGDILETSIFKINAVQPGHLIRIKSGNNIGTYIVSSVTPSGVGNHTITLSNTLTLSLPSALYSATTDELTFENPTDLNTIKVGDIFKDASFTDFVISAVDVVGNKLTLDNTGTPDISSGGIITRTSPVLQNSDPSSVVFLVLDSAKPIQKLGAEGLENSNETIRKTNAEVPLDAYYLVRIDSKERDNHISIINRIWEEFNPPRTALPVIARSALSACRPLTVSVPSGGSSTIDIEDNSDFSINDPVYIFNDLQPSKSSNGKFQSPFESKIVGKISTTQLILADVVPDTFTTSNCSKIVSNAEFRLFMFHFVDHITRDTEGAQYWSHELTYWVQIWVDRQGDPQDFNSVTDTSTPIEDLDGTIIIDDP